MSVLRSNWKHRTFILVAAFQKANCGILRAEVSRYKVVVSTGKKKRLAPVLPLASVPYAQTAAKGGNFRLWLTVLGKLLVRVVS
jgi:hypothetical protein